MSIYVHSHRQMLLSTFIFSSVNGGERKSSWLHKGLRIRDCWVLGPKEDTYSSPLRNIVERVGGTQETTQRERQRQSLKQDIASETTNSQHLGMPALGLHRIGLSVARCR